MEVRSRILHPRLLHRLVPGSGRVQRIRAAGLPSHREGGFTLVEVVMTMVLLSVGLLSLAPLMMSVSQGNRFSRDLTLGTALAEDRLEEVLNNPLYSRINDTTYTDEARGTIRAGDSRYARFSRSIVIADSVDLLGQSQLKMVTVTVTWRGLSGQDHSVTLHGRVARF